MWINPAYAQGAAAPGGMDLFIQTFLPFILIFVIMYFLLIRPQQKRMKLHREMLANLRKGDIVITGGGIVGKVRSVSETDDEVTIEIAKGVEIKVIRGSISDVKDKTEPLREVPKDKSADMAKDAAKEQDR
jgi:preprotein translocase subunit YajC